MPQSTVNFDGGQFKNTRASVREELIFTALRNIRDEIDPPLQLDYHETFIKAIKKKHKKRKRLLLPSYGISRTRRMIS